MGTCAHDAATTTGTVTFANAIESIDDAGSGKIRRFDNRDQIFDVGGRIVQHFEAGIDDVGKIVRRNIGRHADGDTGRAIDEQIRKPRWQNQRLVFAAVVIGTEIDRFLVQIFQQLVRDLGHADFGITHRCRVIAVHRAKVALTVNQHVA